MASIVLRGRMTLPGLCLWTSDLQNYERISFCHFNPQIMALCWAALANACRFDTGKRYFVSPSKSVGIITKNSEKASTDHLLSALVWREGPQGHICCHYPRLFSHDHLKEGKRGKALTAAHEHSCLMCLALSLCVLYRHATPALHTLAPRFPYKSKVNITPLSLYLPPLLTWAHPFVQSVWNHTQDNLGWLVTPILGLPAGASCCLLFWGSWAMLSHVTFCSDRKGLYLCCPKQ
jgi:hypothetical protein